MKTAVRVDVERHVRDKAARRGDVVEFGIPADAIVEFDRDD